jgi:hypothetical protein
MTLDDRIASIRTLLKERDDIDARLAQLIGDEPQSAPSEKPAKRAPRAPKPTPKKGTKVCKNCGKPGHMAKTCNRPPVIESKTEEAQKLDEDQFDALKHLQSIGDLISKDFAHDYELPLAQVNRAIASRNYEEYIGF